MKFKCIDGTIVDVNLSKHQMKKEGACRSKLQYKVGQRLKKEFQNEVILEEVYIKQERLYFDYYLPHLKLVIEIQGKQHSEHVTFFHKTKREFHQQLDRDSRKRQFCKINNLTLVYMDSKGDVCEC